MSVVAHFRGGPLDGTMRAMEECPPQYRFPMAPPIRWKWCSRCEADALNDPCVCGEIDATEPLTFTEVIYRRLPGVVAGEAVYEVER